ncbi:four helix bundle protein [Candidatus Saccharibacteria bacterium QS_8_54_8]|nr:MAG: four helix bundle protein [Candidatus Saccharibacteria bacterium QS_8_54_8]
MKQDNYDLEERMLDFGARVVKHCSGLRDYEMVSITAQLIRSATSIGANYCEANNAASKQDFRSKIFIAKKEAGETKYWLKMLKRLGDESSERDVLEQESQELLMILQKIVNTMRQKSAK